MLLAFLRARAQQKVRFRRTIRVIAFSGEEQGLFGSRAYAKRAKKNGEPIVFMLQGDMLTYRKPGEPIQCALPQRYYSPAAGDLVKGVIFVFTFWICIGFFFWWKIHHFFLSFFSWGKIWQGFRNHQRSWKEILFANGSVVARIGSKTLCARSYSGYQPRLLLWPSILFWAGLRGHRNLRA